MTIALSRIAAVFLAAAILSLSLGSCARRLIGYSAMNLAGIETPQYWEGKLEDELGVRFGGLPDEWDDGDVKLVGGGVYQSGDDTSGNFGYSVYRLKLPDSGDEIEKRAAAATSWRALPDEALAASLKRHNIKTFSVFSGKDFSLPARGYFCPVYYDEDGPRYELPSPDELRSFAVGLWDADEREFYYISVERIDASVQSGSE